MKLFSLHERRGCAASSFRAERFNATAYMRFGEAFTSAPTFRHASFALPAARRRTRFPKAALDIKACWLNGSRS
jgi:hypothetical protein